MRMIFPSILLAASLTLAPSAANPSPNADQALADFFRAHLENLFQQRPSRATGLGDHRFDHLLEDVSLSTREDWERLTRDTLKALPRQVDYQKLSRDGQIDYEILRHRLEQSLWLDKNTDPYAEDPRVYNTYIVGSIYDLLSQSTLPLETNVSNCLARMEQIPRILKAARENLRRPPRVLVETAIRQNQGALAFYKETLFQLAAPSSQLDALTNASQRVIAKLEPYQAFLETDLLPQATGDWRLGRRKFYKKLELTLDANRSAQEVLQDAEQEFDRVRHEMYVVARQLWSRYFPGNPLPADDAPGRRATLQKVLDEVAKDHGRPETLVADVRSMVDDIKGFIREKGILALPDPDRCQIIEMPEFQRGNSTAYMNSAPPLEANAIGQYAISPPPHDWDEDRVRSYLEEYNRYMLQILTIHEAYPGHYVQFAYSNRNPSLLRRVLASGVYVEGWAVYTEQTMLDQGYGEGDLALRLTQLKFYLRAVANTILDHRMHCRNMTDEEAMQLLTEESFQSDGEARLKVIRAKQSSCQLSTYFVGRMAHYRLRQQIQRELGDRFDLGDYHEAVLNAGPVPVKYLPELVRRKLGLAPQ